MKITIKKSVASAAALAVLLYAAAPTSNATAGLPEGVYQISGLTLKYNDKDERGFNNTGLYIVASGSRVRVIGAWHGIPLSRNAAIERNLSDTLFLRDVENPESLYKFHIKNNIVTGRHAIYDEDGSKQVIDSKATIRQLNRTEADRIKALFGIP